MLWWWFADLKFGWRKLLLWLLIVYSPKYFFHPHMSYWWIQAFWSTCLEEQSYIYMVLLTWGYRRNYFCRRKMLLGCAMTNSFLKSGFRDKSMFCSEMSSTPWKCLLLDAQSFLNFLGNLESLNFLKSCPFWVEPKWPSKLEQVTLTLWASVSLSTKWKEYLPNQHLQIVKKWT